MQAVCTPHCSLKDDWLFGTETYTPSGTISVRLKLRMQVPTYPIFSPYLIVEDLYMELTLRGSGKRSGLFSLRFILFESFLNNKSITHLHIRRIRNHPAGFRLTGART